MIEKNLNIAITPCYGNANAGSTRGKLNIPKEIINAMGITKGDSLVNLKYNERKKQIVITKIDKNEEDNNDKVSK